MKMKLLIYALTFLLFFSCQKQEAIKKFNLEIEEYPIYINNDCNSSAITFRIDKAFRDQFFIFQDSVEVTDDASVIDSSRNYLYYEIELTNHSEKLNDLIFIDRYDDDNTKNIPIKYFDTGDSIQLTSFDIFDEHLGYIDIVENHTWPNLDISQSPNFEFDTDYEVQSAQSIHDEVIGDTIKRIIHTRDIRFINQNNQKSIELPDLESTFYFPNFMGKHLDYRTKDFDLNSTINIDKDLNGTQLKVKGDFRLMFAIKDKLVTPRYLVQAKKIGFNQQRVYTSCTDYSLITNESIILPYYVQIDVVESKAH